MIRWYDRQGNPIADMRAMETMLEDPEYKRVAETTLPDGRWVSTVWLGLDHRMSLLDDSGAPLIFETMLFESKTHLIDMDCERASTEQEALQCHDRMVFSRLMLGAADVWD